MKKTYSIFCILVFVMAVAKAEVVKNPNYNDSSQLSKIDESDLLLSDEALGESTKKEIESKKNSTTSPREEVEFDAPIDPNYLNEPSKANFISKQESSDDELEDDELYFDDFSDLGINVNDLLKDKKRLVKKTKEEPLIAIKEEKKVDVGLLQLSCAEFSGRVAREAFSSCGIGSKEYLNSKLELTIDDIGRISTFDSTMNLASQKKLCLSGYVASKPAKNVGANFTCRIYFQ